MASALLSRPRTLAQARRRKSFVLTLVVAAMAAVPLLWWANSAPAEICYIDPYPDGTWIAVNFDPTSGFPDDCVVTVWKEAL